MPGDEQTTPPTATAAPATAAPAPSSAAPSTGNLSDSLAGASLSDALARPAPPPDPGQGGTRDPGIARERFRMPTFDAEAYNPETKKKGMWVDAAPAKDDPSALRADKGGKVADRRQVKGYAEPSPADAQSAAAGLKGGNLTEHEAVAMRPEVASQINPLSDVPRNILKKAFGSTWSKAKHALIGAGPGPEMVMTKLWEFRQFHHEKILNDTKAALDSSDGTDALTEWASAGSTTLTSDIDINLKGSKTEKAVEVFNEKFKADGFPFESGVVYDVNVYALDFMHANTFAKGGVNEDGKRISGKEGQREGMQQGGFSATVKGAQDKEKDASNQEEWSLVKMRIYMSSPEWEAYKSLTDPKGAAGDKWARVEARYQKYVDELRKRMGDEVLPEVDRAEKISKTGIEQLKDSAARSLKGKALPADGSDDGAAENALMSAQNRTYETKLKTILGVRGELKKLIDRYNTQLEVLNEPAATALQNQIDDMLLELRELMSEAALYSNEAYITDGAVNHAVVGIQSGVDIAQTKTESFAAANENVADVLKEMGRHGDSVGEAVYKASKYMWRLGDTARNMGAGDVLFVNEFYDVGFKVANEVKGGGGGGGLSKEKQAFEIAKGPLRVSKDDKSGVSELMLTTRTLGRMLGTWFKEQEATRHERGAAISNKNTSAPASAASQSS